MMKLRRNLQNKYVRVFSTSFNKFMKTSNDKLISETECEKNKNNSNFDKQEMTNKICQMNCRIYRIDVIIFIMTCCISVFFNIILWISLKNIHNDAKLNKQFFDDVLNYENDRNTNQKNFLIKKN